MIISLIPLYVVYVINFFRYKKYYPHAQISPKAILFDTQIGRRTIIQGGVKIKHSQIGDHTYITGTEGGGICTHIADTTIGKYCSIAHNLEIIPSSHILSSISTYPFYALQQESVLDKKYHTEDVQKGRVVIGNDVWIGVNVTILGNVHIGDGAVIGAGALVTKDIPPYAIVVGSPAKVIRFRLKRSDINRLEKIAWWNWDDAMVEKCQRHLLANNIQKLVKAYEKN